MNQSQIEMTKPTTTKTKKSEGEVVREYGPFGEGGVHGVTFDGKLVWFARDNELVAFDPETEKVVRRLAVPADAGTAFDGEHLYQLAAGEILVIEPADGRIIRKLPAPGKGVDSGMAYADGYLWVGQYKDAKIHQVDAKTGEIVKTLSSDRYVTGVSCFGGALWHGVSDDDGCELRRIGPDGSVEEAIAVEGVKHISGVEGTSSGDFWCGGGKAGKVRLIRRSAKSKSS